MIGCSHYTGLNPNDVYSCICRSSVNIYMFKAENFIHNYVLVLVKFCPYELVLVLPMYSGLSLVCHYPRVGSIPVVITHADFAAGSHSLNLTFTLSNGGIGSTIISFVVEGESPELACVYVPVHTCV